MKLLSIIIPVYNAEKTIGRCLDSILCQNTQNAEIIVVNDGSTDRSQALCEAYVAENDNVPAYLRPETQGWIWRKVNLFCLLTTMTRYLRTI